MAQDKGTLKVWKDDKGFGFIKPDVGDKDVFVHIRDFGNIPRKPRVGDVIQYQPMKGQDSRLRAGDVHIVGVARGNTRQNIKKQSRNKQLQVKTRSSIWPTISSFALICILVFIGYNYFQSNFNVRSSYSAETASGDVIIQQAFLNRRSNLQVSGSGIVVRTLPDDMNGSRHQKIILRLSSGLTLLIAHNIDLAPRISSLKEGDSIAFNGEYEWNDKGGVVHWTHHDPAGSHENGWIKHEGRMYQ